MSKVLRVTIEVVDLKDAEAEADIHMVNVISMISLRQAVDPEEIFNLNIQDFKDRAWNSVVMLGVLD